MLSMEEVQPGSRVTHKNTRLCYLVVEAGEDEVLLSHESDDLQDLLVPVKLFREEFALTDRFED